jgi:hypothetical protein
LEAECLLPAGQQKDKAMVITRRNTRLLMLTLVLVLVALLIASAVMLHAGHPVLPGHVFADANTPDVIIHNH